MSYLVTVEEFASSLIKKPCKLNSIRVAFSLSTPKGAFSYQNLPCSQVQKKVFVESYRSIVFSV